MASTPQIGAGRPVAVFRRPLAGPVFSAALATVVAYGLLLYFRGDGFELEYPFAVAVTLGLALGIFSVVLERHRQGLVMDSAGLNDVKSGTYMRWADINEVSIDVLSAGDAKVRYACLKSDRGDIAFTDRVGRAANDGALIFDTPQAPLALAIAVSHIGARDLFPPQWRDDGADDREIPRVETTVERVEKAAPLKKSVAGIVALAFKIAPKFLKVFLKLIKSVKPGAALVTVGAYSLIFSWEFAVVLMGLILVHECGHIFAMWRSGVPTKGIYFIPFFGAVAVAKNRAATRRQSAYISINGPVWGTLLSLVCFAAYAATELRYPFLGAVAAWGALLNLFNLLPILPLDGGRILSSIAYSARQHVGFLITLASLIFGGYLAYFWQLELLVLMVFIGALEFGNHLGGVSAVNGLKLVGDRPMNAEVIKHFAKFVAPTFPGNGKQSQTIAKRHQALWENMAENTSVEPMTLSQSLLMVGVYAALVALLLGVLFALKDVPGAGNPLEFLY